MNYHIYKLLIHYNIIQNHLLFISSAQIEMDDEFDEWQEAPA